MHARGRSSGPFALGAALTPATAGVTQGPPSHTGGGEAVTRHRVLTCPSVPAILAAWLQRLTCLTSARFRARAPGPVSGQLCSAPGGRAGHTGAGFLLPFGRRPSLLGASCPARGVPPLLRSAYRAAGGADPSGVFMFRTRETRLAKDALWTPGAAVPARPELLPAAACRISTACPCRPGLQLAPGRIIDEASARVHCHSPHTSLPLTCNPRAERDPRAFP